MKRLRNQKDIHQATSKRQTFSRDGYLVCSGAPDCHEFATVVVTTEGLAAPDNLSRVVVCISQLGLGSKCWQPRIDPSYIVKIVSVHTSIHHVPIVHRRHRPYSEPISTQEQST